MNQKTENPLTTKAASEAKTDTKTAQEKATKTPDATSEKPAESASQSTTHIGTGPGFSSNSNALSPEIIELLTELRDTVKGLNPRKHTPKTLRRALSNVSDILTDIDKLYQQD